MVALGPQAAQAPSEMTDDAVPGRNYWDLIHCSCVRTVEPNLREGAMGAILLWLLGVPLPIILILLLLWH